MFLLFKHDEPSSTDIDNVSFRIGNVKFTGEGILSWNINNGFTLTANFKANKKLPSGKYSIGRSKIIPNKLISFKINKTWKAFSYCPFSDIDELKLRTSGKLELRFDNIIFHSGIVYNSDPSIIKGKSIFKLVDGVFLSDKVTYEVKLLEELISQESKNTGIFIDDNLIKIKGYLEKNNLLIIFWESYKTKLNKQQLWDLAVTIKHSLAISLGATVHLIQREIYYPNKTVVELFKDVKIRKLYNFSPINGDVYLDKKLFLDLIYLLKERRNKNAVIIRNLFYQIVDALQTNNFHLIEFLISSSLESFLRTFYNKPFIGSKKDDDFKSIVPFMKKFRIEYFSDDYKKEWKKVFKNVIDIFEYLRHSNAHAEWTHLIKSNTSWYEQKRIDYLIYLVKFYGYVIYALLGYKNLKPNIKLHGITTGSS